MARHEERNAPTESELQSLLGPSYPALAALLEGWSDLQPGWKWHGQSDAWTLQLLEGKRRLCVVKPADGRFTVGFTLGHDAVQRALKSRLGPDILRAVAGARTNAEGRPVEIEIRSPDELEPVHALIRIQGGKGVRRAGAGRLERSDVAGPHETGPRRRGPAADRRSGPQQRGRSPE